MVMLSTRTSRTLPNAEWYLPAKRQCWREVQYPYHPWSYHIYLHEYHKNQPFMYRHINTSFVDGMGYTPLEWGPSKWWLWWFVLKRYFPNSPASKIMTIFCISIHMSTQKLGNTSAWNPWKEKTTTDFSGTDWSRMQWTLWSQNLEILLPENGPESPPLKRDHLKKKWIIFQPSIFRGY